MLQLTYWLNSQLSGDDTFSYHVVNLLIHYVASGLIFLIVLRLVRMERCGKAPPEGAGGARGIPLPAASGSN